MSERLRDAAVVILVGCVVLLTNLGGTSLWDLDEALWSSTAAEMSRRGDWVMPWHNGEVSTHKPPLMFWVMMIATRICGETEFAFRIGSAAFGLATALAVQWLGGLLFCRRAGLLAGVATVTALNVALVARAATPDVKLTFFTTLALALFARHALPGGTAPPGRIATLPVADAVGLYAALGFAVLTKGPLGVALPTAALGLFAWWHNLAAAGPAAGLTVGGRLARIGREWLAAARCLRPFTGMLVVLAIAGPWYVLVQRASGGAFGADFIGFHHVRRFLQPIEGHSGPIYYFLPALLVGTFPWSMFAIPTVLDAAARLRGVRPGSGGVRLLVAWLVVWIVPFSLAQTKLPNYILPAYPAALLLVAVFLTGWLTAPDLASRWWVRVALALFVGIGAAVTAGCWAAPRIEVGGRGLLEIAKVSPEVGDVLRSAAWGGLIMAGGGLACLALAARDRRGALLAVYGGTAAALAVFLFACVVVAADRHQPAAELVRILRAHGVTPATPLGQCQFTQPSLVHYAGRRVEPCREADGCREFFRRFPDGVLVVRGSDEAAARKLLPAGTEVIGGCADFPKAGRIVVARRGTATAGVAAEPPR